MRKPVIAYANIKGADQPAQPRSLISAFVIHCLDGMNTSSFCIQNINLYLASVAAQANLSLTWSEIPKMGFLVTRFMWCTVCSDHVHLY